MSKVAVDVNALSKPERLQLLEELWDSLDVEVDVPISDAQRSELKARSRLLHAGGLKTAPLEDVLEAIRSRRAGS